MRTFLVLYGALLVGLSALCAFYLPTLMPPIVAGVLVAGYATGVALLWKAVA